MTHLHPYEYVAFNSLAGDVGGASRNYELDYWGTSLEEASRGLAQIVARGASPHGTAPIARVFVCGDKLSAAYFLPANVQVTDRIDNADFFMAPVVAACDPLPRQGGRVVYQVKRDGAVLSRVLDLHPATTRVAGTAGARS